MFFLKPKLYAFLWHLFISFVLFVCCALVLYFFWYPSIHFWVNGGIEGLKIIFIVDMFIGPLLTLFTYQKTKLQKEKISDFSIIALIQLAALIYGMRTVYLDKPAFMFVTQGGTASVVTLRDFRKNYQGVFLHDMPKITGVLTAFQGKKEDKNQGYVPISEYMQAFSESQKKLFFELEQKKSFSTAENPFVLSSDLEAFLKREGYFIHLFGHYGEALICVDKNLHNDAVIKSNSCDL